VDTDSLIPYTYCGENTNPDAKIRHRSFSIWSVGFVLIELLVWYAQDVSGVKDFRDARNLPKTVELLAGVELSNLNEHGRENKVFVGSLSIIQLLLDPQRSKCPSFREMEVLLRALLGEDVRLLSQGIRFEPHIKVYSLSS